MAKVTPLEEMTLNELKEELGKRGHEAIAKTLNTKPQALAVLTGLMTTPANPEKVELPPGEVVSPTRERQDTRNWQSKAKIMEEKLKNQEKVQVFLALEGKETAGKVVERIVDGQRQVQTEGAVETVIINGYVTYIPKGVPVSVPLQIAAALGQAQTDTAQAGKEFELDRPDTEHPETPYKTVGEALQ